MSALNGIYQTFGGEELYPSVEEKAANLLYFVVKNHPFVDGNKHIRALMFLMFLYDNLGFDELIEKFNNNALTALCYLVAGSRPDQKEILINLITQMIGNEVQI
ncbi:type II toxin-antitoxin system death-on-curing family toxin [Hippea alviniae]|uniref:type II toxin-antitoxin system death-on-curing family toxin n=1 Tax=Hippea alviniae TaxID=1279027 RepID=UPI000415188A|nr:Fic family protein [Hippea alviniae]